MPDEPLTPEMIRELDALDTALAGRPVEPDLADLAELTALLREERPEADPTFARALDDRVKRGFPRRAQGRAVPAPHGAARLRAWLSGALRSPVALGAAATIVLAAVVVGISQAPHGGDDSGSAGGGGGGGGGGAASAPAPAKRSAPESAGSQSDSGQAQSIAPAPPAGGGSPRSDSRAQRFVERSAAITLGAQPRDLDDVADGVVRVTDSVGGFVGSSSVTSGREATFELRIPSAQLQRALRDLSRLAHVRERTQQTEDITSSVVSARDRLQDARAERAGLLRRLARADTDAESARLRARLRTVSRNIARYKTAVSRVENRARFANVSVEVVADRSAATTDDGGAWTPGDALRDAGRILEVAAGVAVVAGAAMLPLALVAALAWLAGRRAVRRRREAALDAL
jgi:Domain of unknown function (DUF4349)